MTKNLDNKRIKKTKKTSDKRTLPLHLSTTNKLEKFAKDSSKQLTLQEALDQRKMWDINDKGSKIIHKYIG